MIEIIPVGGYSEIGRNCTIVKWKDESVMMDFGLMMENYTTIQSEYDEIPTSVLIRENAVPDIESIPDEIKKLNAVVISHAHLDHIGAIPYFTGKLKAPIYGSKFTIEVIKAISSDKGKKIHNQLIAKKTDCKFKVSKNIKVEFIHVTHSTPQSVIIAIHTPDGVVVYANDFKLDDEPVLGEKTNFEALKKLKNVKALIMDSLYALQFGKSKTELETRKELKKILIEESHKNKNILITTFSSQIARLKTIKDIAEEIGREVVFVGRSLNKYIEAAKKAKVTDLTKNAKIIKFGSQIERYFRTNKDTTKSIYVVTGHQGEPNAVLSRMSKGKFFPFNDEDSVIFSCNIIPIEECFQNRERLEKELKARNIEVIKGIHSSGHAQTEEHKQLIQILKPEHILPTHGDPEMLEAQRQQCKSLGYEDKNIHILKNFSKIYL
ncbi:MBL fold metallo-hydrolase [Candidatus Woesearchaeota archaeon]|nr:MBL fold metallo-hydrolase [Candidatus Woesearchaeota archaeon]MCF7900620.1 MBL fold metallo-hydrolase [Candidatus Woesearchaeota archaeon]MCF8013461.1 MBL fold metallo-hydrolase [Candidatus Woesearchaeota archaeon]